MLSKNMMKLNRVAGVLNAGGKVGVRRRGGWAKDGVVSSPYQELQVPNATLNEYVWQNLDKWPQRTAAVCAVTGRGYSYEQAFRLSHRFAACLRGRLQLRTDGAVAVMLPNVPDYPLVVLGVLEAGGLITTVNPVYTAHEVEKQLSLARPQVIVTLPKLVDTVKQALRKAELNAHVIVVKTDGEPTPEGAISFSELAEDVHVDTSCLKQVRSSPTDVCLLPFSSGTTGLPKGVELTHRNIIANCEQINEPHIRCHNDTTPSHQDAVMTILPLFHIYAISVIMFHKMAQGIKLVTMPRLQPDSFLQALQKHRTNLLFAAPPLIILMATHPGARPETFKHLDVIINGAAPLAASDAEKLLEKAKRKLDFRQGYGLTETSPVVTMTPRGLENYSCVGHALPSTQLKIVDPELNALGPNQTGELLVKGPQVMRGYFKNPTATANTFTDDGWFRTGDLAIIDDDGITTIADRLKELIKVKGYQVAPAELEGVLREHPAVVDAAVVGVPHATHGETPRGFVVLRQGAKTGPDEIKDFVKERVAPFKRIDDIVFLENIPKSAAGKILRREIKEKYC